MSPIRGTGPLGLGLLLAAGLAHGLPAVSALPAVRSRLTPRLGGTGRADHLALTFDDGPDPASTGAFLSVLDRLSWKATFFMLGTMARRAPGLAAEVAAAGHEIAVHGDVHVSQLARSPRAVIDDVARARDTLAELTGQAPRWNRPPYGVLAGAGVLAARRAGLSVVLWSTWGRDWRQDATADSVVTDILAGLPGGPRGRPGGTILLHDSDCTSDPGSWRSALDALPLLAERLDGAGWTVGPLRDHGLPGDGGGRDGR
jgi:peptidoglycan/xylan/chitin deacetylase (PgdA/CDA1 family)